MTSWLKKFTFNKPDSSFLPMGDIGYMNDNGAKVRYQVLPADFKIVLKDFIKEQLTGVDSIIFRENYSIQSHNGYLIKSYYKSPSKVYEDYIALQFIMPYQQVTIVLTAAYLLSKDKYLFPRMIKSFGTIKPVE